MNPGPHRLRPFKKYTPAPLLFLKIVKTPAGVYSDTPAPVHLCKTGFFSTFCFIAQNCGKGLQRSH